MGTDFSFKSNDSPSIKEKRVFVLKKKKRVMTLIWAKMSRRAGEMPRCVEHLLSEHEEC